MNKQNDDVLLENQSLKAEFNAHELDLTQVFYATPDDLSRENRVLRQLLAWVQKYTECGDRTQMEAEGYLFPPIDPDISPENDWHRFELWMQGCPLRKKLREQLPMGYEPPNPKQLTEEEVTSALRTLSEHLFDIQLSIDFREEVPPRLAYEQLIETLEEEFDLIEEGFWHLAGCTGYCPDCFQRPWCDMGCQSCWPEDEKAGKMFLTTSVKDYVSASPVSLNLLRQLQAEQDSQFEEFKHVQYDCWEIDNSV